MKKSRFKIVCLMLAVMMVFMAVPVVASTENADVKCNDSCCVFDYSASGIDLIIAYSENFFAEREDWDCDTQIIFDEHRGGAIDRIIAYSENFVAEREDFDVSRQSIEPFSLRCMSCGSSSLRFRNWLQIWPDACTQQWWRMYSCNNCGQDMMWFSDTTWHCNLVPFTGLPGLWMRCTRCGRLVHV